jgi:hypothetical protein
MMSRLCSRSSHTWQTGADIWCAPLPWDPMEGSDIKLSHVQYFVCNLSALFRWHSYAVHLSLHLSSVCKWSGHCKCWKQTGKSEVQIPEAQDTFCNKTALKILETRIIGNVFCSRMLYSMYVVWVYVNVCCIVCMWCECMWMCAAYLVDIVFIRPSGSSSCSILNNFSSRR